LQVPPIFFWIPAVEIGCFYSLIAVAYLVIQRGAGFFNFAIGSYAMIAGLGSAYAAATLGWSTVPAIIGGLLLAVVLGLLTEVLVVRPIDAVAPGQELPALIAVVAVLFALEQAAGTAFGRLSLLGIDWVPNDVVTVGTLNLQVPGIFLVVTTVVIFAALQGWTSLTKFGQMLQAVGDNKHAAEVIGLPVSRIRLVAFGVGGLIAAVAGSVWAFKAGVHYDQGFDFALQGFLTLVVAGRATLWAPLVGGLLFATLQQLAVFYFGGAALDYVTLMVALVFFALRPGGIFVRRARV
jgi:branched-chain amino acid transport system permease protein